MSNAARFLAGHACNTLGVGVQIILIAWLAVGVLRLAPAHVGWVQAAVLVPNVLMLALVGKWVEQANACRVLQRANIALAAVHIVFALLFVAGQAGFPALLCYAVCLGSLNAAVQNARETLLGRLASDHSLQKHISRVAFVQFGAQAVGVGLGLLLEVFTIAWLLGAQALLCLAASGCYSGTRLLAAAVGPEGGIEDPSMRFALREAARMPTLRSVLLIVAFNGFTHMGFFLVLLPILATRMLGVIATGYVTLQLAFILGSIIISGRLMFGAPVKHAGQHVLFAALYTGVLGLALAAGPKPSGLYFLVFCWGLVAGGSANLCRLVVQTLAPANSRARTMSLYQTALFGAAPLGSLACGYLVHAFDTQLALQVMAMASFALFALTAGHKSLWQFTSAAAARTPSDSPRR